MSQMSLAVVILVGEAAASVCTCMSETRCATGSRTAIKFTATEEFINLG